MYRKLSISCAPCNRDKYALFHSIQRIRYTNVCERVLMFAAVICHCMCACNTRHNQANSVREVPLHHIVCVITSRKNIHFESSNDLK